MMMMMIMIMMMMMRWVVGAWRCYLLDLALEEVLEVLGEGLELVLVELLPVLHRLPEREHTTPAKRTHGETKAFSGWQGSMRASTQEQDTVLCR
jgi:hypothetical protein